MIRSIAILSIASACLAGCTTMAPSYTRPDAPVSAAWPTGPAYKNSGADKSPDTRVADIPWRRVLCRQAAAER